jgi:hypothetical protein
MRKRKNSKSLLVLSLGPHVSFLKRGKASTEMNLIREGLSGELASMQLLEQCLGLRTHIPL